MFVMLMMKPEVVFYIVEDHHQLNIQLIIMMMMIIIINDHIHQVLVKIIVLMISKHLLYLIIHKTQMEDLHVDEVLEIQLLILMITEVELKRIIKHQLVGCHLGMTIPIKYKKIYNYMKNYEMNIIKLLIVDI